MSSVDLSNYAALFILGIIVCASFLALIGYKLEGKDGARISIMATILGFYLSIFVGPLTFKDATPGIVMIISIGTLILPLLYIIILSLRFFKKKYKDNIKKEILFIQQEISDLEKQIEQNKSILNLINLLMLCGTDTSDFEQQAELSNIKNLQAEKNKLYKQKQRLSSKL